MANTTMNSTTPTFVLTFSAPVDSATANNTNITMAHGGTNTPLGTFSVQNVNEVHCQPTSQLATMTTYTITISGVTASGGTATMAEPFSFSFETGMM